MKKKFQIILSISNLVLVIVGFLFFSMLAKKYIINEIVEQVVNDNLIIGNEMLAYLQMDIETRNEDELIEIIQNICDEVSLPNMGFICAIRQDGEILAAPGFQKGEEMNLGFTYLTDHSSGNTISLDELDPNATFAGEVGIFGGEKTNIIASLPVSTTGIRLNVHQDNDSINKRAARYDRTFFIIGFIVAALLSLIGYFTISRIVNRYESKIEKQAVKIKNAYDDISDSIQYAAYLQSAIMPTKKILSELLPDHFILFRPKEAVSGDFYCVSEYEDKIYFSAIDCTGHGVPGAFMSIMGFTYLNQAIHKDNISRPSEILNDLCSNVHKTLERPESDSEVTDGMDMVLCSLDKKNNKLEFAAAKNPLYLFRDKKLTEYKGDKYSIGMACGKIVKKYTNHQIELKSGDVLYMFSDGYADQFGGPNGKKFMAKRFREKLLEIHQEDMEIQKQILEETLDEWIKHPNSEGNTIDQIDDILVFGVKI